MITLVLVLRQSIENHSKGLTGRSSRRDDFKSEFRSDRNALGPLRWDGGTAGGIYLNLVWHVHSIIIWYRFVRLVVHIRNRNGYDFVSVVSILNWLSVSAQDNISFICILCFFDWFR